jgi:hypothetical protein
MSTNPLYIASPPLQYFFVDRDTGEPLSGGRIFTYSDINRATPKNTYQLQGNQANYTYVPLPNPIILSAEGTIVDNNGNNVVPLWYPYNAEGEPELYYVVVQSATGVPQFTLQAWPYPSATNSNTNNENSIFNYIPNGQFLAHTDLPDNVLLPGTNVIAQGGWTIELDSGATSTNTLTFIENAYTQNPPESPRYSINFACTVPVGNEVLKDIRIKFPDVNKFSDQGLYTYGFWMKSTFTVPFVVEVVAYYGTGGTPRPAYDQQIGQVTTEGTFFSFPINFGSGSGYNVGPDGDDFIAIDISFPTDTAFNITFTDAVLAYGLTTALVAFPTQTNADMLTRGVAGWMPTPNPDGSDLYLPLVLTKSGMIFDPSSIGQIITLPAAIPAPSDPLATTNLMTFDASSYINSEYSALGIPYSRLGTFLLDNSPIANIPLFGTGADFATCYAYAGSPITLRLPFNAFGTGSTAAFDGNTVWAFTTIPTFNGSTTGSASMGILAVSNVANTLLAYYATSFGATTAPDPGTSGFTINILNPYTGSVINQNLSQTLSTYTILAVGGSTFVTGSAGKYFTFPNSVTSVINGMWFNTGTETVPTVSGSPPLIEVFIAATATAQDVANIVRETLNALQSTQFVVSTVPSFASQATWYWEFYTNPASPTHFYVWYKLGTLGTDPNIPNATGILVQLNGSGETTTTVATKTLQAINAYQYAVPGPGMFLRSYDPTGVWDFDVAQRWSSISGLSGANYGTFEFDQFQQHGHPNDVSTSYSVTSNRRFSQTNTNTSSTGATASSGGSETRPVNMFVNYAIRY